MRFVDVAVSLSIDVDRLTHSVNERKQERERWDCSHIEDIQGSAKRRSPGLVSFVPAVAYHFFHYLLKQFSQPGAQFSKLCICVPHSLFLRNSHLFLAAKAETAADVGQSRSGMHGYHSRQTQSHTCCPRFARRASGTIQK